MAGPGRPSPARLAVLVSFAVLFLGTGIAFGVTEAGHVAILQSDSISATVADTSYAGGSPPVVTVDIRFANPTPRDVTVTSTRQIVITTGDETIVRSTTPRIAPWPLRIPAGGTATATARIHLEAPSETASMAIAAGNVTIIGVFDARIGEQSVQITLGSAIDG